MTLSSDTYLAWREQGGPALGFREPPASAHPPERWLQEIWAHQRLRRDQLVTTEGRKITVLHPGFWNREAGPDFLRAVLQVGDADPVSGDVEIDLVSGAWKSHGHAGNAAYQDVILHVVWDPPAAGPQPLTTVAVRDALDAPFDELRSWVGGAGETPVEWLQGQCSGPLRQLAPADLQELLRQAAQVRLQTKAYLFRARARVVGWHQALWEGVFRALGYKHNAWPMQRLAELLPAVRLVPSEARDARQLWEARLFGLSGLLPTEPKPGTRGRRLWDLWWRERGTFRSSLLPPALWRFHGVRPANHPQRRLALAAAWIADPQWETRLEQWFQTDLEPGSGDTSLIQALGTGTESFWRRHYTLDSRELPDAPTLLGTGRVNDLAVNAILPWFWARADAGAEAAVKQRVETRYHAWPAGEDNATLKLVRARLFGTDNLPIRKTAAAQQGLLQIVRDFCSHSNALCHECRFPALVGTLAPRPQPDPALP